MGGGKTRALPHTINSIHLLEREINDEPRKSGRSLGRGKSQADCAGRKNKSTPGGKIAGPFSTTVYVDGYVLMKVQRADNGMTALIASASLTSDHVRLLGPGEEGITPTLAPAESTDRDTTIDALGFTINSHTKKISLPRVKVDAIKKLLREQRPVTRKQAKVGEADRMAGKLWNLTYVVRAGRYFVSRMLTLTGLHDSRVSNEQNITEELGREVYADLASPGSGQ